MGQVLIRNLDDALIADYKKKAADQGRSLEAELRNALTAMRPRTQYSKSELLALSDRLLALSGDMVTSDSTPYIRWMRDTNDGRIEDGNEERIARARR